MGIVEETGKDMSAPRMPFALRVWLLATRALPLLISPISRQLHNRMGAVPERFAERRGQPSKTMDGPVLWFHAASLGEVSQIEPLVAHLGQSGRTILVTTTTAAGADWVARELPDAVHQYAPMDTPVAVAGFLDSWEISASVYIEGDLSPRLVLETQARGIPQVLLNARHSRTRERFSHVFATLLSGFSLVTCRSDQVASGIRTLGVPADRVKVLPDLRIATAKLPCPADVVNAVKAQIGDRLVWLAASTHATDDAPVLAAHRKIIEAHPNALLILAPRHPRRAEDVLARVAEAGFKVARRSRGDVLTAETQVYLADTLGELGVFFSIAPVSFVGGSFGDEGGHNPYEPAQFGSAILSGPKVKNFDIAYAALSEIGAAEILDEAGALGPRLATLIGTDQVERMGDAGLRFMDASENSVSQTVELIEKILGKGGSII